MEDNVRISSEIDEIIAKAMREYKNAKGIDVFSETPVTQEQASASTPKEEPKKPPMIVNNSKSALVSMNTSRFSSADWYLNIQTKRVILAGIGGIGSYVAFLLSRLNIKELIMYDDDVVDMTNLSGQLYRTDDIGLPKCDALSDTINHFSCYFNTVSMIEKYDYDSPAGDIMICGFDNMEARKVFFTKWLHHVMEKSTIGDRKKCLFIDGRLAAESFQVLCITGENEYAIKEYTDNFLFSDSEADETICSYKQTTFMANMIGSIMTNLFVNFCANETDILIPRDLPFYTEYTAETMFFKVKS